MRPSEPARAALRAGSLQLRYRGLRRLLATNSEMLELMADLEADLYHLHPGQVQLRQPILRLLDWSLLLAENLNVLSGNRYPELYDAHRRIDRAVRRFLKSTPPPAAQPLLIMLGEAGLARARQVGGKAANLGELRTVMPALVPDGFVVTTAAYRLFLEENGLHEPIRTLLKDLSLLTDRELLRERLAAIRALVEASRVPDKAAKAVDDGLAKAALPEGSAWAVRSSAVGEDGRMSFAGQFDSELNVAPGDLLSAYKKVIASRYTERALTYRLIGGFTEVDTPMAVLFLPMIEARSAGVLYTRDPRDQAAEHMLINSVWGLAESMVRGSSEADTFIAGRLSPGEIVEAHAAAPSSDSGPSLSAADIRTLVEAGLRIEAHFGSPRDIEWVIGRDGGLMIVQSRALGVEDRRVHWGQSLEVRTPLLRGGSSIFPGRAVGPAFVTDSSDDFSHVPEGAILVVHQATPELGARLPFLAGVISEHGNPSGHAATLLREFRVPGLFGVEGARDLIKSGQSLSLDATHRRVYEGALWPEVMDRVRTRIQQSQQNKKSSPLHDLILVLNLTDPLSLNFRAKSCKSVHDIIRFTHERAVSAMFDLGDEVSTRHQVKPILLDTNVPLNLLVLDLGGALPANGSAGRGKARPEEILSIPFQALWKGVSHPGVTWSGRMTASSKGFMSVMASTLTDPAASIRQLGERNYLVVTPEYLNFNGRLAYHFAMIDSLVTDVPENNYVNFRFRGGAAGIGRRGLRARFLGEVLLESDFSVDRRGDLVTAWLRRYPRAESEAGLETLGKLMACARQLDMLLDSEDAVRRYVEKFLRGDYQAFA